MHNTTHYRTLTLFAVMFLALVVTGCPGGNKQKETSPKKKTEKEGISSTNEADTDNKNNGKTLDHYKQIFLMHYRKYSEFKSRETKLLPEGQSTPLLMSKQQRE